MFEYLMPLVLMKSHHGDAPRPELPERRAPPDRLRAVARRAVGHQRVGIQLRRPARPVPVPRVRRPGPRPQARASRDDVVISPYSTALAAMVDPEAAVEEPPRARARRACSRATASTRRSTTLRSTGFGGREDERAVEPRDRDAGDRAVVPRAPPGHDAGRARERPHGLGRWCGGSTRTRASSATEMLLQERLPRDVVDHEAAARRGRADRDARRRPPRSGGSGRRTRPGPRRTSSRTATSGRSSRTPAAEARAAAAAWSRESARTGRATSAVSSSTCATCGAARSGRRRYQPIGRERRGLRGRSSIAEKAVFRRVDDEHRDAARDRGVARRTTSRCGGSSLTNRSDRPREIEVTSFAELALAPMTEDLAHPAFGKLFLETPWLPEQRGDPLCAPPPAAAEGVRRVARPRPQHGVAAARADRMGDGPRAVPRPGPRPSRIPSRSTGAPLSGTTGAVLDPIASIRVRVRLAPGAFVRLAFATGVAPDLAGRDGARRDVPRSRARPRARSRSRSRTRRWSSATSASPRRTRSSSVGSRRASSTSTRRCGPAPASLQHEQARTAGLLGPRDLGRPADPRS